jgi:hypothetical protein
VGLEVFVFPEDREAGVDQRRSDADAQDQANKYLEDGLHGLSPATAFSGIALLLARDDLTAIRSTGRIKTAWRWLPG